VFIVRCWKGETNFTAQDVDDRAEGEWGKRVGDRKRELFRGGTEQVLRERWGGSNSLSRTGLVANTRRGRAKEKKERTGILAVGKVR